MENEDFVSADNAIELNLLDTNLSPEKLTIFTKVAHEEGELLMIRMWRRLANHGFMPNEITACMNNVIGSVSEHHEVVQEAMREVGGDNG